MLKKKNVKNIAKSDSDFNHDSNYNFYKFYKSYDEFEEMPLDSKYNWIKKINNLLIKFKALKPKKNRHTTQKGANYEKCWWALRKVLQCLQKQLWQRWWVKRG